MDEHRIRRLCSCCEINITRCSEQGLITSTIRLGSLPTRSARGLVKGQEPAQPYILDPERAHGVLARHPVLRMSAFSGVAVYCGDIIPRVSGQGLTRGSTQLVCRSVPQSKTALHNYQFPAVNAVMTRQLLVWQQNGTAGAECTALQYQSE